MSPKIVSDFAVTSWEETPGEDNPGKVVVKKRFSGSVAGESVADLMACQPSETQRAYIASDRFTGAVEGRSGGFVMHHGATQDGNEFRLFGNIEPGSGTGERIGIRGSVRFDRDERGACFTLDYELPEGGAA